MPYISRNSSFLSLAYIFVTDNTSLSLFNFVAVGSKRWMFISAYWSFKVIQGRWFWYQSNWKCMCNFLLVRQSNLGPTLHRFWDTVTHWLKITNFSYPSLIRHLFCNFAVKSTVKKLESRAILQWRQHQCIIVARVVLTWYRTVTDGQTYGRTDLESRAILQWRQHHCS